MTKYLFDTNAFNRLLDDFSNPDTSGDIKIYGSHIQRRELEATKNTERKEALLNLFYDVTDEMLQTESMVFHIEFGSAIFGDGTYEELRTDLDKEAGKLKSKPKKNKLKNNPNDAKIGEISVKNNLTLVTNDLELAIVVRNMNTVVLSYDEFKSERGWQL